MNALVTANNQFKRERERLEEIMTATQVRSWATHALASPPCTCTVCERASVSVCP